ncbi:MAG TPA: type II toxin-antitoxin system VapC family toxin [Gemmatimonadales bacterium]|nr:type II toxin-antitoxin system VapC family toxin [Gemmatimonadales bacterium]
MRLVDVNVLVYAFREDAARHADFRRWLDGVVRSDESYAVSDHVLSGFLRVVTHPRVFHPPTPLDAAIAFTERFRGQPNAVPVAPDARHWDLFTRLCRDAGARGNLIPDAWLAALAIESGSELVTTDRDYARFTGLRWRHPLDP